MSTPNTDFIRNRPLILSLAQALDASNAASVDQFIAYLEANYSNYSQEIANAVAALVDSSPATLDTLNELAAALGDDPNFATTVTNQLATKYSSTDLATQTEAEAGTATNKLMTPQRTKQAIEALGGGDSLSLSYSPSKRFNLNPLPGIQYSSGRVSENKISLSPILLEGVMNVEKIHFPQLSADKYTSAAIYGSINGFPGPLLAKTANVIATSTMTVPLLQNVVLEPGLYWIGSNVAYSSVQYSSKNTYASSTGIQRFLPLDATNFSLTAPGLEDPASRSMNASFVWPTTLAGTAFLFPAFVTHAEIVSAPL